MIAELLKQKLPALDDGQRAQLAAYYALLREGNERMNLTTILEPAEVVEKHFLDSLSAVPLIPQNARCIDIGAGAGLPGIPLLITRPDIRLTMLDSLQKRVSFLEETLSALALQADCVHGRAEELARLIKMREQFDIAVARAVAPLNVLLELTAPFLRVGGTLIAYKGKAAEEEAAQAQNAAKKLQFVIQVQRVRAEYGERALVVCQKKAATPAAYPRKPGEAKRKPL